VFPRSLMKLCLRLKGVVHAYWTTTWAMKNWTARIQMIDASRIAPVEPGLRDADEFSLFISMTSDNKLINDVVSDTRPPPGILEGPLGPEHEHHSRG
jgi:hypothetical protein